MYMKPLYRTTHFVQFKRVNEAFGDRNVTSSKMGAKTWDRQIRTNIRIYFTYWSTLHNPNTSYQSIYTQFKDKITYLLVYAGGSVYGELASDSACGPILTIQPIYR